VACNLSLFYYYLHLQLINLQHSKLYMILRSVFFTASVFSLIFLACSNTNPVPSKNNKAGSNFIFNALNETQRANYNSQIAPLYNNLLVHSGFNGGILVAKNGEIVFEDYLGYINHSTKELINSSSKFHIASVSKTFTAMAILQLMEQGKINLDAYINNYLPNFPYHNITVKDLLSHRSGLANYVYFMDGKIRETITVKGRRGRLVKKTIVKNDEFVKNGLLTNEDVLQYIIARKPLTEALPNTRFKYCNTNYILLACIVEKVSGIDFPNYMQKNIFEPLGMQNTYIFSIKDTASYIPSYRGAFSPYKIEKFDCVYGDKNVYSTPRDLLLWDKALYSNKLVSDGTMKLAYTPYSNEKLGTHNYGLGWRLFTYTNNLIPYHNGWWHGNNAAFTRMIKDTATVIVLGNKYNNTIYKAKQLLSVFNSDATNLEDGVDEQQVIMPMATTTPLTTTTIERKN
jgi:CubicO group peptidase (beta-lactamase class C family)